MPNYTKNYNLKKPLQEEFYNIDDHNGNMDILDETLKHLSEKSGVVISPNEPETGDVWIDTDDESGASGNGGAVSSVNGKTGEVILNLSDLGAAPSSHGHEISDVNGLQDALDDKSNSNHTHTGYAPNSHTHGASEVKAGTFAGQVVANSNGQSYSTYLLRNSRLSSSVLNPTVNGTICWQYE